MAYPNFLLTVKYKKRGGNLMIKHKIGMPCMIATFMMMFAFLHPVHASNSFKDMQKYGWAKNGVEYLAEKGAINGVGDNQFAPQKELTRGEAAKIIALLLQLDVDSNKKTNFIDAKTHWASPYIKAIQIAKPGLLDGYPDGTFKPNKLVTREELAKMIVLSYGFVKEPGYSHPFNDVSGWSADYIETLASKGIVQGKGEGKFTPKDHIIRAEAAVMIYLANESFPSIANPDFQFKKTYEEDGLEFEVMFSQLHGRLYVRSTATNISKDSVPYIGFDGCDQGFSANLVAKINDEQIKEGSVWRNPVIACTAAIQEFSLEPGETIEEMEVINLPIEGLKENHYVNVRFNKHLYDRDFPSTPVDLNIPLEEYLYSK